VVSALEELPGVKKAVASFPEKKAIVTYDQFSVTIDKICQALLKAGYVANPRTNDRKILTAIFDESQEKTDTAHDIDDLICYCFGYTRDNIEQDYIKNGRSLIMEKIAAEKKTGGCDCAIKNPKGR
jgi:copper chaperone CopZ